MKDNLIIYNKFSTPPEWAKKEILAGRLKGKTDINPQWRIKCLTEEFGIVGFGWKYTIDKQEIVEGANKEMAAFATVSLFIKMGNEWSDAIIGTGGSSFVTQEKNGLYVSDECFKMAVTDALSVCCKLIGIGSDIYSGSKYDKKAESALQDKKATSPINAELISDYKELIQIMHDSQLLNDDEFAAATPKATWTEETYTKALAGARKRKYDREHQLAEAHGLN